MSIDSTVDIALLSLVVVGLFTVIRAAASADKLNFRLASASWDNQSWTSNLAAVGTILGIVIGASSSLPQTDLALTAIVLSIFFGALIILGPISYLGLQVREGGSLEGTVWAAFVASGLTLWAAVGEAATAAAFFVDLRDKLPGLIVWLFVGLVALAVILLLRYAWLGMGSIVDLAVPPAPPGPQVREDQPKPWRLI